MRRSDAITQSPESQQQGTAHYNAQKVCWAVLIADAKWFGIHTHYLSVH
jgi:hypothetical protein